MRNGFLLAKFEELLIAFTAIGCFKRAWFVIQAGVDYSAVMAGLVPGYVFLFFDKD
jgi:hypothetical protein